MTYARILQQIVFVHIGQRKQDKYRGKELIAMKMNCWEAKQCGREPGGVKVGEFGICPAVTEKRLDGVHAGKNGGRACWVITGTYCQGDIQGAFAKKFASCMNCDFYKTVQSEEFPNVELSVDLIRRITDEQ